jgi:tetratricopeptide (TPR) repeat protein
MKKLILPAVLSIIVLAGSQTLFCQEKIDDSIVEAVQSVHEADIKSDFKLYMENHSFFERCLNMDQNNYIAKYYLAYIEFKLYQFKQSNTKVDVDKYYDTALEYCKDLVDKKKYESEAKTVMAGLYMMRLANDQMEAMALMPQIHALLSEAEAAPGKNPRPLIIKGIMQLNTPPMFGGSVEKAIDTFTLAVSIFEKEKNDNIIRWGYEETLAWLGQAYAKNKLFDKAKEAYEKALKIEPEYAWIKFVLMPQLEKQNKN